MFHSNEKMSIFFAWWVRQTWWNSGEQADCDDMIPMVRKKRRHVKDHHDIERQLLGGFLKWPPCAGCSNDGDSPHRQHTFRPYRWEKDDLNGEHASRLKHDLLSVWGLQREKLRRRVGNQILHWPLQPSFVLSRQRSFVWTLSTLSACGHRTTTRTSADPSTPSWFILNHKETTKPHVQVYRRSYIVYNR